MIGRHIIIQEKKPVEPEIVLPEVFALSGYVTDAIKGTPIINATVYESFENNSVLSDERGFYSMEIAPQHKPLAVSVSRLGYLDTVIVIRPKTKSYLSIGLVPEYKPVDSVVPIRIAGLDIGGPNVEDMRFVKFVVPEKQRSLAQNVLNRVKRVPFQLSLVPGVSTNRILSGGMENRFSLNILAGYAHSLRGVEIGGLVNIDRQTVSGAQFAGIANFAGGPVKGIQFSGFYNHVNQEFSGLQATGFGNIILKNGKGVQLAGFLNGVGGKFTGIQMAGGFNTTLKEMRGIQLAGLGNFANGGVTGLQGAGFFNVARTDVTSQWAGVGNLAFSGTGKSQFAGFFNYGRQVGGVQGSGFVNFALDSVVGSQVTGFINYGTNVGGFQGSGFVNVAGKTVKGSQLTGFINYGRDVGGLQASGFVNISSRSVRGSQVSGFVNFGMNVKGAQVGLINIADTLHGVALGLINISRNGYVRLGFTNNEVTGLNAEFRSGKSYLYTIFGAGMNDFNSIKRWAYFAGLGGRYRIWREMYIENDFTVNWINDSRIWANEFNMILRFNPRIVIRPWGPVEIFAGPTMNVQFHNQIDPDTGLPGSTIGYPSLFALGDGIMEWRGWVGYQAGIQFDLVNYKSDWKTKHKRKKKKDENDPL